LKIFFAPSFVIHPLHFYSVQNLECPNTYIHFDTSSSDL